MPSTFTTSLRLEKQADGENSSTWGQKENTSRDLTESSIAGFASVAFTNSDVTLTTNNGSSDQARNMMLKATGTLSANVNMIVPAVSKVYIIWNGTTGAFTFTVKTASGTGVTVESGKVAVLFCDGTNVGRGQTDLTSLFIKNPTYHVFTSNSGTSFAINYNNGTLQEITLTGNVTFTLTNPPASGTAGQIRLILKQDATGSRTITWPASIKWTGTDNESTAPALGTTAGYYNIIDLYTRDNGTTWVGARIGGGGSSGTGSAPSATEGTYVAVGSNGKLTSSTDGVTWVLQASQLSGANLVQCFSSSGRFHFSKSDLDTTSGRFTTNGTTFTTWGSTSSSWSVSKIGACTNGNLVLIDGSSSTSNKWLYSTNNGTSWTEATTNSTANRHIGAINSNEVLVVRVGAVGLAGAAAQFMHSTDAAVTWSSLANHSWSGGAGEITQNTFAGYINGKWCFGSVDGMIGYKSSISGTTVTVGNTLSGSNQVNKILYTGTKVVAFGNAGKCANASDFSSSWTNRTTSLSGNIVDAFFNSGTIVIITDTGEIAYSTNDGDSWTSVTGADNPFGGSALSKVKFRLNQWMIGAAGGKFGVSTDGTSFTLRTMGMGADTINDFDAV